MRLRRFDLRAYGHFTDLSLDLAPGLNILYGDNEAGKSTALRALGQLLFGFTHVCHDGFLHPLQSLRVGGLIEDHAGRELACIRRKSRVDSLRAADDVTVLPNDALDKLLGGIERARFESQFGINYEQLVAGGREICSGQGDLGEILFAAASGVSHLGRILRQLEDEAGQLFSARSNATKAGINKALSERHKKLQEAKQLQLTTSDWENLALGLDHNREELVRINDELRRLNKDRERKRRLQQALPLIARRQPLTAQKPRLATVPLLADGFEERRIKLQNDQIAAQTRRDELQAALTVLAQNIAEIDVADDLLNGAPRILQLNQDLGSHLKAQRDRHRLDGQLNQLNDGILSRLRELGRDVESLPEQGFGISRQQRARIQKLAKEGVGFVKDVQSRHERQREIESDVERLTQECRQQTDVTSVEELRAAVTHIQSCGSLETQLLQKRTLLENARKQADLDLKSLGLWTGELENLEELAVPSIETVSQFESEATSAEAQQELLESQIRASQQQVDDVTRQLARFQLEHDVPTADDLRDARGLRDAGWLLVRQTLERGAAGADAEAVRDFLDKWPGTGSLAGAYAASVAAADDVADRLRRDADLVAQKSQLLADQGRLNAALVLQQADRERLGSEAADRDRRWTELWRAVQIDPRSPAEMRSWVSRCAQLKERARAVREQSSEVQQVTDQIAGFEARLRDVLAQQRVAADGAGLAELVGLAVACVNRADEAARKRSQGETALRKAQSDLAEATQISQTALEAVATWRAQWTTCMEVLALSGEASIEEATAVLETMDDIITQQSKARELADRIQGIDAEGAAFQSRLAAVLDELAADLRVLAEEQALAQLVERLQAAQDARTRRQQLLDQRQERDAQLNDAGETLRRCEAGLALLCREADCRSADDLAQAERNSRERRQLEKDLADVEGRLTELAVGGDLDDLLRQAAECEPDLVNVEIAELDAKLATLEQQRDVLLTAIGGQNTELERMDGSGKAADAQAEAEALLAQVRADAERYVRLKLAMRVLRDTTEQFRQKNQGPILELASRLFARLTLGSFCGLRVELDDQAEPSLLGVRTGANAVPLSGMSDGTSDQLFLALRIASLEIYFRDHAPIPFIVDDILIKFDDDRSIAALETLHELAQHTQVVMFTHHQHLLDIAESRLPAGACTIARVGLPEAP